MCAYPMVNAHTMAEEQTLTHTLKSFFAVQSRNDAP